MRSFRVQLAPADHDSARPKPPRHGDPALAAPPGRHDAQNQSQRRRRPLSQPPVTNRDSDTGLGPDDPPVVVLPPEHCQQLLPRPLSPGAAYPTVPPAQHLHPGVVPYRIRSASPQCARSDPPGVWLDIDEDEDNDDNDSDGTECLSPSDDGFDSDGYYGDGPSRLLDGAPFDYDHDCATPGAPSGCADWPAGPVRRWRAQHATTPPSLALTPFVNQVGGHTPFLKFSGSAICKPMNERERRFYEAVDYLHPDLYKFVPSCLGVVNVTYRRPLDGSDPVPEVFLEQNLHILPSCLARQLVPSRASQPQCTAAPGSFGARKMRLSGAWREMQERILKDALSPRALKVRARQQARMRAQGPIRRRHSSTDLHPAHHIAAVPVSDRGLADESQDEARSLTADNSGEPRDPAGAQLGPIYSVAVSRSSTADTESNDGDSSPALSSQPNASGGRGHERCREPPLTPNIPTMPLPEAN
ncbi:inositol polyphosphate kinase kcs1, partial [Coemansia spiralis]